MHQNANLYNENDNVTLRNIFENIKKDNVDQKGLSDTELDFKPQVVTVSPNTSLSDSIKEIINSNKKSKPIVYFTADKAKYVYNIDLTIFKPTSLTLLAGKNFKQAYIKQLESNIFDREENINVNNIMAVLQVYSLINQQHFPINIASGKYKSLLSKIVDSLNEFMNSNKTVIHHIYTSVNSIKDTEKESQTANAASD